MALPDDLWRECAAWLTRCKIIPSDHRFLHNFISRPQRKMIQAKNSSLPLSNPNRANWSNSEIKILALTLRDGVLLCNLIHFLDPSMEPKEFNRRPRDAQVFVVDLILCSYLDQGRIFPTFNNAPLSLQFLCLQNIRIFLDCCRTHFQIRDADLFEAQMLYDLTHFHRVLITLSKLSQCRKAQINQPNIV